MDKWLQDYSENRPYVALNCQIQTECAAAYTMVIIKGQLT